MARFTWDPSGPFTLSTFAEFGCGLLAASRACSREALSIAFPRDGTHAPIGVRLREVSGRLEGEVFGDADVEAVRAQVARMLSLEHDARPFVELVGRSKPLQKAYESHRGFRPPIFHSPYAAAGWLVLAQRTSRAQAARVQEALARESGDVVDVAGTLVASFPRPETFLKRSGFPGIPAPKWARLQAVARAALAGRLDPGRLRAMEKDAVLADLQQIEGIGPWTAAGVYLRSLGLADAFIVDEPQVHRAVALAYGLDEVPDDAQLAEIAEEWRPFRSWVTVLLTMAWHRAGAPGREDVRPRGGRPRSVAQRGFGFSTARPARATT